jgi:hypothetical protein
MHWHIGSGRATALALSENAVRMRAMRATEGNCILDRA